MSIRYWLAAAASLALGGQPASATVYYVDFAAGNDANSGKSTATPWKHAPGDPNATGVAASAYPVGGDIVRFRAGVPYRGTVKVRGGGTATARIIYTGLGWGTGRAIIDGADPVTSAVPCPSQAECGGAPNWASLKLVTFNVPPIAGVKLFDTTGPLYEALYPAAPDPFWGDDINNYVKTPVSQASAIESGRLDNAMLADKARAGGPNLRLSFWISGNLIDHRKIDSVSGNSIFFTPNGLKLYHDRDGRVGLVGSPAALSVAGTYALIGPGKAIVLPRSTGGALSLGSGRVGFDLQSRSYVTVDGFQFLRGYGSPGSLSEGMAVRNGSYSIAKGWRITNNIFGPAALMHGLGIVTLSSADGPVVQGNSFDTIERGSGLRTGSYVSNVSFLDNHIRRVGRTALYFAGVKKGWVKGNIVRDIKGIHGNGMSFYLANQNITVEYNCIYDTIRPITYKGDSKGSASTTNNLVIRYNIAIGTPDSSAAITSWGGNARVVAVQRNAALAAKFGLRLDSSDYSVTANYNRTAGVQIVGTKPGGWVVSPNTTNSTLAGTYNMTLTPTYCSAPSYTGTIVVGSPTA